MGNLISRIKEKPFKYVTQGTVGLMFINETLEGVILWGERVAKYESQIRDTIGPIGYWTAQIGVPTLDIAVIALLGYVATKGTGMLLDEKWYGSQTKVK